MPTPSVNSTGNNWRYFSNQFNISKSSPVFTYLYDSTASFTDTIGNITTGQWRPIFPTDLSSSINVSGGLSVSVGNVHETGVVQSQITNFPAISAVSGTVSLSSNSVSVSNFPATQTTHDTGTVNVAITNSPTVSVSNLSGAVIPSFNILRSGQSLNIPTGSRKWGIALSAGSLYVNNNLYSSTISMDGGGYGGFFLGSAISCSGTTGCLAYVNYEG